MVSGHCLGCPFGTYKEGSQYYASSCTKCPAEKGITVETNATSIQDCKTGMNKITLLWVFIGSLNIGLGSLTILNCVT